MSFSGKVVIVTGASSGIGAVTAEFFCREGASVALIGRNEARLKNIATKCNAAGAKQGGKYIVIKADVANDDDVKRIIDETIKSFKKIDILLNNAGVMLYGTILSGKVLDTFDQVSRINLRAVVHLTMLAAPYLVKTKGNIVNISSIAGQMLLGPKLTAYCTSKAGLLHFSRGAALEFAPLGVRVNAVCPGPTETELFNTSGIPLEKVMEGYTSPLGRNSQSEEIADLILFLASDKSKGTTGAAFTADNGIMLAN